MVSDPSMDFIKDDSLATRFDGKNFTLWEHQFRIHVQDKGLRPYLTGDATEPVAPKPTDDEVLTWQTNNAKVISWILASITAPIALSLRYFTTAADIWKHLTKTYTQVNASRQFEIEYELAKLCQGDLDIHSYYLAASQMWTEQDLMVSSLHDSATSAILIAERNRSRILQFLMRLRPEYESVRAALVSGNVTDMEQILGELVRAETRFKTQAQIDAPGAASIAFSALRAASYNRKPSNSGNALSSQDAYCRHYSEKVHSTSHCLKRNFCNYCKTPGHIILDCSALKNKSAKTPNRGAYSVAAATSASA
ncbi:hypothetical protein LINGRAPRIM_LOCUS3260 [Linum grandiflorum]